MKHSAWKITSAKYGYRMRSLYARGFTLIELLAVTGIIVVISSIILSSNSAFGGTVTLRSFTYDVALTVRQAQIYGISVRKFRGAAAGTEFGQGYGIHFQLSSPTQYLIFADVDKNGHYTPGGTGVVEELEKAFYISQNFKVQDLCVTPAVPDNAPELCYSANPSDPLAPASLDIVFLRPEPDAHIRINSASTLYQRARIVMQAPRGNRMSVSVEATGQIAVQ